jgi:hypothetical protein
MIKSLPCPSWLPPKTSFGAVTDTAPQHLNEPHDRSGHHWHRIAQGSQWEPAERPVAFRETQSFCPIPIKRSDKCAVTSTRKSSVFRHAVLRTGFPDVLWESSFDWQERAKCSPDRGGNRTFSRNPIKAAVACRGNLIGISARGNCVPDSHACFRTGDSSSEGAPNAFESGIKSPRFARTSSVNLQAVAPFPKAGDSNTGIDDHALLAVVARSSRPSSP